VQGLTLATESVAKRKQQKQSSSSDEEEEAEGWGEEVVGEKQSALALPSLISLILPVPVVLFSRVCLRCLRIKGVRATARASVQILTQNGSVDVSNISVYCYYYTTHSRVLAVPSCRVVYIVYRLLVVDGLHGTVPGDAVSVWPFCDKMVVRAICLQGLLQSCQMIFLEFLP